MSSKNTLVMRARICDLTGKRPNRQARVVTFSNQRNKTVQHVNLQWKRFFSEALDRQVRLRVSTKAIRTVTKLGGIDKAAKKYEVDLAKF
jgi:large subunit ribosomal protein L28